MLFETAAALLGVSSADVWFVGDRVDTDIVGARAAGMTPVLFSPTERPAVDTELITLTWSGIVTMLRETVA
jgi:FMN phosphatase YigB (HAD superfamily)